jgi:hypothetical protein
MMTRSLLFLAILPCLAGCASAYGTTVHTLRGKPELEIRKVEDDTRLGWHKELWLRVDGVAVPFGTTEPPVPLDPERVYTFTVLRVESFTEIHFSLVRISEGEKLIYHRP